MVTDLRRFFARANEDLYGMLGWGPGCGGDLLL